MRALVQRVSSATVDIAGLRHSGIGRGLLVLLGIEAADGPDDVMWLVGKVARLRVFPDAQGLMNLDLAGIDGEVLVVSQFTLFAATAKGNRPSFVRAARPEQAEPLYRDFVCALERETARSVATGSFGADMRVTLVNDGPVTILIDSRNRE